MKDMKGLRSWRRGVVALLVLVLLTLGSVAAPLLAAKPSPPAGEGAVSGDLVYVSEGYGGRVAVLDSTGLGRVQYLPAGVPAPDWSELYVVDHERTQTRVRALDPVTGQARRETRFEGLRYALPWTSIGGNVGGLSPDGRWLALWWEPTDVDYNEFERTGRWQSRFVVLDTAFKEKPRTVELEGHFSFDALSNGGRWLYLIEYLQPAGSASYRVRLYDLAVGRLDGRVIADKRNFETTMTGERLASIPSADGRWLFSLYLRQDAHLTASGGAPEGAGAHAHEHAENGAFIHALNLAERYAICIDLSTWDGQPFEELLQSSLALAPDGRTLYVANGALGSVTDIDTQDFTVRRTARLVAPAAEIGPDDLLRRLAAWLAPTAQAKVMPVGSTAVSPDGETLYTLAPHGYLAVDTSDLTVRGHYLREWGFNSMALSADGARLYAASLVEKRVVQVELHGDGGDGEIRTVLGGVSYPAVVLHVGRK